MNEDGIGGAGRRTAGEATEALGRLAANDRLGTDGIVGQALGTVQDSYGRARERVRALLDAAPSTARDVVATGRDFYRRGSEAVTRNATDNTALTLLAAGIAVAAVSWLVFGRRRDKGDA